LNNDILTGATGILRTTNDEHPELSRNGIELLADVLADPVKNIPATWAGVVVDIDEHLDAWQVCRKRASVGPPLRRPCLMFCRRGYLFLCLAGRLDLFGLFKAKKKLIVRERFGTAAEAVTLQFLDDLAQPGVLGFPRKHHCLQRIQIIRKLIYPRRHAQR
jgi:hypothetical protein